MKLKHVLPAMALILVVGAVVMALRPAARQEAALTARAIEGDPYYCDQCRKEFRMKREDWSKFVVDPVIAAKDRMASRRPHCPLCGTKHSGWMMVVCPKCQTHYLPAGMGPGPAAGKPDVCPKCGSDRTYGTNRTR